MKHISSALVIDCAGSISPGAQLTEIQDLAIQARMALIVGAETFDRLKALN